jgi:glycosyltransferase involved in cell wall biosynthesis
MTTLPTISIVTPSYNQAVFLDAAIGSVLGQNYPVAEYVVIDGGSSDGSVDIIRRHADRLHYWISEPDNGQYDAINKGFAHTTGEIMAWLNSDDQYTPWAFRIVAEIFANFPQIDWLTTLFPIVWDLRGQAARTGSVPGFSRQGFWRGEHLPNAGWYATCIVQQESTFWRRSLWERAGGRIDTSVKMAGDFALWAKFYSITDLYGVKTTLGGFRVHPDQKTAHLLSEYTAEAAQVLSSYGARPYSALESLIRSRFLKYIPVRLALRLKLRYPYPIVVHVDREDRWKVEWL